MGKCWVNEFKQGNEGAEDDARVQKASTASTLENIDLVLDMVMEDRRLPTRQTADRLGYSQERVSNILAIELGSRKMSTRWVACLLRVLSQEQMGTRQTIIWNFLKLIQMTFWHDSLIMGEHWVHYSHLETKVQSK